MKFQDIDIFGGKISQVFIYSRALSDNEVEELYTKTHRY